MKPKDRYFFHEKAYERVVDHIETYGKHFKGELTGQPIVLPDWFKEQLKIIYGRYDRTTHRRAIREAWIEIPKKNAKSLYVSALGNYHMTGDGYYDEDGEWHPELSPDVVCLASTKDQAKIVFEGSQYMVKKSPDLLERLRPMQYSTVQRKGAGAMKVMAAEPDAIEGINTSAIIGDEAHVWEWSLYTASKGAGAARPQPLTFFITTAGVHDPTSLYYDRHAYALKVIDNWEFDPHFHGCIYTAGQDKSDEYYLSIDAVKKANPNYPNAPKKEYIESRIQEVKNNPTLMPFFKRYHLNVIVQSHSEWIPQKYVKSCSHGEISKDGKMWIGFDVGDTDDLTALTGLIQTGTKKFEVEEEGKTVTQELPTFDLRMKCFCPADKIDAVKNNSDHITYIEWARQGWVDIAGTSDINTYYIEEVIDGWIKEYSVRAITFDRWGAGELGVRLDQKYSNRRKDFISVLNMNAMAVSPPMKKLGGMIRTGQINTNGNPVFEWMMGNVQIKIDANNNIFPNKKEAKGKIDGVVAAICSTDGWLNDKYKNRDLSSFEAMIV